MFTYEMTEIESRTNEGGASNESIPNTSSFNEVEFVVDTSKKRRVMEPRVACWKHFDKFIDENGANKAKCKYCGKTYAAATKNNEMPRDVLAIPISSVASECAFSTGGRILDPFRSSLTPKLVQSLICLQDWLRSEPIPINIEEDLEYLEQLELDMACGGNESTIVDM